jgi:hypothetical protein
VELVRPLIHDLWSQLTQIPHVHPALLPSRLETDRGASVNVFGQAQQTYLLTPVDYRNHGIVRARAERTFNRALVSTWTSSGSTAAGLWVGG